MTQTPLRCEWVNTDPVYIHYHDTEWGVPVWEDHALFERLCLEGAQAGLSWITILRKREHYRAAYDGFDPQRVAAYDDAKRAALLANPGLVRNRAKIDASIANARLFLTLQVEYGTFAGYLWQYVGGKPVQNHWSTLADVPAQTPVSQAMSKDLIRRGFKFVGPTICYAMMQAVGMVNDHVQPCFRHAEVAALGGETA